VDFVAHHHVEAGLVSGFGFVVSFGFGFVGCVRWCVLRERGFGDQLFGA